MNSISFFKIISALWLLFNTFVSAAGDRKLAAIRKSAHLRRRAVDFNPDLNEKILYYADDLFGERPTPMLIARISLEPRIPSLFLDDLDEHIQQVTCNGTEMMLSFHSESTMESAIQSWTRQEELLFITSHVTCAHKDVHAAFIVSSLSKGDSAFSVAFKARRTSLKQSCSKVSVDLGEHLILDIDPKELHKRLPLPQVSQQPSATSSDVKSAASSITVTFDYPTPTASPTGTFLSQDMSFSYVNTTLVPPDNSIASLLTSVIQIPDGVTLRCLNCSMNGMVSLEAAGFSVDTNSSSKIHLVSEVESIGTVQDFFDSGYFQFNATGISANMSFELAFQPGFSIPVFTARLPDIPLGAIEIAGLLTFGPVLQFLFPMSITLNSPMTFSTGFTLSVPPESTLVLNVSQPNASYSTGFQDTQLTPLPFNADIQDLSLNFSVGFQPKIVLAAALLDAAPSSAFEADGGVGAYLDLPQLVASVSVLNDTNEHCNGSASKNTDQTFIHVVPFANFAAGVEWDLDVGVLDEHYRRGGGLEFYQISHALPTECLMWDSKAKGLVNATTSTSGNGGTNDSEKNGAVTLMKDMPLLKDSCLAVWMCIAIALLML